LWEFWRAAFITFPSTRHPSLPLVSQLSYRSLQEEWVQRLTAAETSAAERLAGEVGKVKAEVAAIESCRDLSAARMTDLQSQLDSLQRQHASLADEHSTSGWEARSLKVGLNL